MPVTKKDTLSHPRLRALERYGLEFSEEDLVRLARRIDSGGYGVVHLGHDPENPWRHLVAVREANRWLAVIYNAFDRTLITFLPRKSIAHREQELRQAKQELKAATGAESRR